MENMFTSGNNRVAVVLNSTSAPMELLLVNNVVVNHNAKNSNTQCLNLSNSTQLKHDFNK